MPKRTQIDIDEALKRDRSHLEQWRSTTQGEADYRTTVDRVLRAIERMRAASD